MKFLSGNCQFRDCVNYVSILRLGYNRLIELRPIKIMVAYFIQILVEIVFLFSWIKFFYDIDWGRVKQNCSISIIY